MSCHPGELKRGDLPALVLATAHAQAQTEAELYAAVCAAGGVRYSPERHNRVVRQLILLGYLHPDHLTVTTAGRAELARQRTPLRRGMKPKARVATLNAVVLEPLAAYGPLTTHELARQLAVTPQRAAAFLTYVASAGQAQAVTRTDASGHAAQAWEITLAGRAFFCMPTSKTETRPDEHSGRARGLDVVGTEEQRGREQHQQQHLSDFFAFPLTPAPDHLTDDGQSYGRTHGMRPDGDVQSNENGDQHQRQNDLHRHGQPHGESIEVRFPGEALR